MDIKLLYNPQKGKVLVGLSKHAMMVRPHEFDSMVRAIYFKDRNVVYFRFWAPDSVYELTSWAEQRSRNVCERALRAFVENGLVRKDAHVLFWETGNGVNELDIKY